MFRLGLFLVTVLVVSLTCRQVEGAELPGVSCPVQPSDCSRCALNAANIGYLAHCTDDQLFYQCTRTGDGSFALNLMSCPNCTMWDQTPLTCVRDLNNNNSCGTDESPGSVLVVGDICYTVHGKYEKVTGDEAKFYQYSNGVKQEMPCAMGTIFELTACRCNIHAAPVAAAPPSPDVCITFESMDTASKWGFSDPGPVWVSNHDKNNDDNWQSTHVQMSATDCKVGSQCGLFDGQSFLTVDSLANSFHTWRAFTISFWYKPADDTTTMGMITNGMANGCSSLPSVSMTLNSNVISALVYRDDGQFALVTGSVMPTVWNHVSLTRDEAYVSLYINNNPTATGAQALAGEMRNTQCPMMVGLDGNGAFFKGKMDQICFDKTS